jgi:ribonuclease P protein subunit RPR2
MAKEKSKSGLKNKHLHARVAFLHQAATYLTDRRAPLLRGEQGSAGKIATNEQPDKASDQQREAGGTDSGTTPSQHRIISINKPSSGGLPLYLSSYLSQVARKSQIRLAPEVKHSICKRCGTIQVEGSTCKKFTENSSKGGKKRHADVLVQECEVCGAKKRWPIGAQRQRKKSQRTQMTANAKDIRQADPGATDLTHTEGKAG